MPDIRKPEFSASRLMKWMGRLVEQAVSARPASYIFETPPFLARQSVRNRKTGARTRFVIRSKNDLSIAKQIYASEDYCLGRLTRYDDILARYDSILATGRTPLIVDCGGNIGLSALYFSEHFPSARIVTIEPDDANFAALSANCEGRSIIPVHAAISAEASRGRVIDVGRGSAAYQVEPDPDGSLVFTTVPEILSEYGADCTPFLIKIDIEGFEEDLFSKPAPWLADFYLIIMELHDWMMPRQARSRNFLKALAPLERDFVHIHENIFSIAN